MSEPGIVLRPWQEADLSDVNNVVEQAIMGWNLPARVKRLSLSGYRYDKADVAHQQGLLACDASGQIVGVAVWEPAPDEVVPGAGNVFRLHGLYVTPSRQRQGIGRRLLDTVIRKVCETGADGLVIRAQADAVPFFQALGLDHLPVADPARDYANRFYAACDAHVSRASRSNHE